MPDLVSGQYYLLDMAPDHNPDINFLVVERFGVVFPQLQGALGSNTINVLLFHYANFFWRFFIAQHLCT